MLNRSEAVSPNLSSCQGRKCDKDPCLPKTPLASGAQNLLSELRGLIDQARRHVAQTANAAQTLLYWHMGLRIGKEVLKGQRADYGEQIVATLSTQLVQEYGRGFNRSALARMIRFSEAFPDEGIVATLSQQLSWSHFVEIIPLLQRDAEVVERFRVARLVGRQLFQLIDRSGEVPLVHQRRRQIQARGGIVLVRRDHRAELLRRGGAVTLLHQGEPQAVLDVGRGRIELHRPLEAGHRLVQIAAAL